MVSRRLFESKSVIRLMKVILVYEGQSEYVNYLESRNYGGRKKLNPLSEGGRYL